MVSQPPRRRKKDKDKGRRRPPPTRPLAPVVPSRQGVTHVPSAPDAPIAPWSFLQPVSAVPPMQAAPVQPNAAVDHRGYPLFPPGVAPHIVSMPSRDPQIRPTPRMAAPLPPRDLGPVEPPPVFAAAAQAGPPPPPPRGMTPTWGEAYDVLRALARAGHMLPPDPMMMLFGDPRGGR